MVPAAPGLWEAAAGRLGRCWRGEGRGERRPCCGCRRREARSSRRTRVWGTRPGPCWRGSGCQLPPRREAWLLCCSACSSLCGPGDRRPRNWTLAAFAETRLGLGPDPLRGVWKAQNVAWVAAALGTAVALGPARGCRLWACKGASGRPPLRSWGRHPCVSCGTGIGGRGRGRGLWMCWFHFKHTGSLTPRSNSRTLRLTTLKCAAQSFFSTFTGVYDGRCSNFRAFPALGEGALCASPLSIPQAPAATAPLPVSGLASSAFHRLGVPRHVACWAWPPKGTFAELIHVVTGPAVLLVAQPHPCYG